MGLVSNICKDAPRTIHEACL